MDCPDNLLALNDVIPNYTLTKPLPGGKDLFKDSEDIDLSALLCLYTESLSEALLKAEGGGAIAVWASSGLTEPAAQAILNRELLKALFNGGSITLGAAANKAKAATPDPDVRRTWILFGDPTTQLKN